MMKVGITGADGTIGTVLRKGLSNRHELELFTFGENKEIESTKIDLSKSDEIVGRFSGLEALIHLAADPSPSASWESVKINNIEATYNVFNECRRAGISKIVFASTNHTQHGDTLLTTTETLDRSKNKILSLSNPTNPDSLYAVSKLFGEDLGKYFSEKYEIKFVGLRIGWVVRGNDPTIMHGTASEEYMRAMYLSHGDCLQAFERALEVENKYLIAYAISNNTRKIFELEETIDTLDYHPVDDSDEYF
jgi:nucleoside-diphosphate-sugar epimerase